MNIIPEDDLHKNLHLYILDPLSVIIKLAIINYKPIGTKIRIDNNVIHIQEPGIFQPLCRFFLNNNKGDIHFLYNPIEYACRKYLNRKSKNSKEMKELFISAQNGLKKLSETYKNCSLIGISLTHFWCMIQYHVIGLESEQSLQLFQPNKMSEYYTELFLTNTSSLWTSQTIDAILTLLSSLNSNPINVNTIETIVTNVDVNIKNIRIL